MEVSARFFKVTNQNEIHKGFCYKDGINVDRVAFQPIGSCVPGGLYFTDRDHIHDFFSYGVWLREVTLPSYDPDFKIVQDFEGGTKWRANKIILGKRYPLEDPNTFLTLDLPMMSFQYAVEQGYLDIVEWWLRAPGVQRFNIFYSFLNKLCTMGRRDILDLLKTPNLPLNYGPDCMEIASRQNSIEVLDWWKNSGLELKYDTKCLEYASSHGNINVLDWWKNSGLKLKYDTKCLENASRQGNINVLNWWKNSGLKLKYDTECFHQAALVGNIEVLDWWENSGLKLKYNQNKIVFSNNATTNWWNRHARENNKVLIKKVCLGNVIMWATYGAFLLGKRK